MCSVTSPPPIRLSADLLARVRQPRQTSICSLAVPKHCARAPDFLRLAEIDAPEKWRFFGNRARQSLGELCHEKRAEVRSVDVDRYKRVVTRVTCASDDANAAQVRRGMAWVYDRYAKDKTLYRLQDEARGVGRGLWADRDPMPPWDWRKRP